MTRRLKRAVRPCGVCGKREALIFHHQDFVLPEGHPLSAGYDVVRCENCGFVYADTGASSADYERFYAEQSKYEDKRNGTGGGQSACDARRLAKTAEYIRAMRPDRKARIVEVGCANGGLLGALKSLGYENLCGIDPSPACAENARRNHGIEAFTGRLSRWPQKLASADCLILSHVLEHVRDIRAALKKVAQRLKPGGMIYVEVPDAARYADYVFSPFQDFNTEHINHFSQTSLENLMRQCGFSMTHCAAKTFETAPGLLYPAVYGLWSYAGKSNQLSSAGIPRDDASAGWIQLYISRSNELMRRVNDKLKRVLKENPEVIVWGTGQLTLKLLSETALAHARIEAFVDGNPVNQEKILRGVAIKGPDYIRDKSTPIIVASMLHQEAIVKDIRKLNASSAIVLLRDYLELAKI